MMKTNPFDPLCPVCGTNHYSYPWEVPCGHGKATTYICVECHILYLENSNTIQDIEANDNPYPAEQHPEYKK